MKQVDVKDFKGLKEAIEENIVEDTLLLTDNGEDKYVLMNIDMYEEMIKDIMLYESSNGEHLENMSLRVDVIDQNGFEAKLSPEEYEELKEKVVEALERQFKPNIKYN